MHTHTFPRSDLVQLQINEEWQDETLGFLLVTSQLSPRGAYSKDVAWKYLEHRMRSNPLKYH